MVDNHASQREVSLRLDEMQRYVDIRFEASEKAVALVEKLMVTRFTSAEKAVAEAKEAMGIRLDRMNEFREQLASERSDYARRAEVELYVQRGVTERVTLQDYNRGEIKRLEDMIHTLENEGHIRRGQERLLQWMGSTVLAAAVAIGIKLLA